MVSLFPWRGGTTGGTFLSSAKMKVAVNRKIVIATEMSRPFIDAPGWRVIQVGADFLPWIGIWQQEKNICLPSRLAEFLHPTLDQRFHSGFSTRQRAGLDYLEEGFHDVSSFSVLTVAGQFLLFKRITFSNSGRSRRTKHVHPTAFACPCRVIAL